MLRTDEKIRIVRREIMKKKILAMILTVAMVLTLIPAMPVLAAVGDEFKVEVTLDDGVTKVDMTFKVLSESGNTGTT